MKRKSPSASPDGPADGGSASTPLTAALSPGTDDAAHPPPPAYDPADYRWVPVRRRPRHDGWTEEKQRRFIETLADTGLVSVAAKAVGMTRESAYKLRRAAHGAAFARAWDAARHHAGSFLEDIAFERAIEGVEHNVYNEYGDVVCTKRVYNDRLLMQMLRHQAGNARRDHRSGAKGHHRLYRSLQRQRSRPQAFQVRT